MRRFLTPSRVLAVLAVAGLAISLGVSSAGAGRSRSAPVAAHHGKGEVRDHGGPSAGCPGARERERNKRNIVAYYTTAFNKGGDGQRHPELAVQRYGGDQYIQHNPQAANGFDAFIGFVRGFIDVQAPSAHIDIKRVLADCNMVVTHGVMTGEIFGQFGTKLVDIFRLDARGKVVEHWDVLAAQVDPATSANGNPEV